MALINLQTQKLSLKKSLVSSSVFRPSAPIASVAKIPFGGVAKAIGSQPKPLQVGNIDAPSEPSALYGIVDALKADVQSLRQEQSETAEILNDIGNALAADFSNRITEEKKYNLLLNRQRIKLRRKEKEDNLESRKLFGNPFKKDSSLKAPSSKTGIFGKLFGLLGTLATGIAITTAFEWLKDDHNREKLSSFFKGMKKHWKWIVGSLATLVAIDLVSKIALIGIALKGLVLALANPLVWAGIGILYAAGHQGWSHSQNKALKILEEKYNGNIPDSYSLFRKLPGVGDYIAAAVMSIAFKKNYPAVDVNLKRVISRYLGIKKLSKRNLVRIDNQLKKMIMNGRPGDINQSLMENFTGVIPKPQKKELKPMFNAVKQNIYGKKIVIGMGAGSISNWMRDLSKLL